MVLWNNVSPISPWITKLRIQYNWILKLIKHTFYFLCPSYKLSCIYEDILIIKSMFQLFKSSVNKQSCFKSDLPALLIPDLMSPFFGFLYWFWKKRMGIGLEWKCILQPILIFHLQVTACTVLLLWTHNENVSEYSHYSSKVREPRLLGPEGLQFVNSKWESYTPRSWQEVCCKPIFSLHQLNQPRIYKQMSHKSSNIETDRMRI